VNGGIGVGKKIGKRKAFICVKGKKHENGHNEQGTLTKNCMERGRKQKRKKTVEVGAGVDAFRTNWPIVNPTGLEKNTLGDQKDEGVAGGSRNKRILKLGCDGNGGKRVKIRFT